MNNLFANYPPEQPVWYSTYIFMSNFSADEQPLCLLVFVSNHLVFISSSLANKMCQRGPGDAGRILPTVLSNLAPFGS